MAQQPGPFPTLPGLTLEQQALFQAAQVNFQQQQGQAQASSRKRKVEEGEEAGISEQPRFASMPPQQAMPPPQTGTMMPPPRRRAEDDAWVLPRRGVQQALKAAGLDKDFKLEGGMELQGALMELYGTLIENAVQFGCSNARMRKSQVLKPRDMAVYLERTWGISVPGFSGEQVRSHRRPAVSEVHRQRLTASRQVVNDTLPKRGGGAAAAAAAVGHQ